MSAGAAAADAGDPREWMTTSEAAAYLGVSQPTVFRWMKEGIVSFYKVGGSTRFSRSALDAVVQKTTGKTEAEAAAMRCASCGHHDLISGRLQGTGRLYFRPDQARFWTFDEGLVPTEAKVCAACGHIQVHADTVKLSRLRRKETSTEE